MSNILITVNHNKCVGSQLCVNFLPEIFELNIHGQSVAKLNEEIDVQKIIATAEQCPQCAIKVVNMYDDTVLFPPPELAF